MQKQLTVKMLKLLASSPLQQCPYCDGHFQMREIQEAEEPDGKISVGIYDCVRCRAWMAVPFE
jgi:uncharacterized cupin superfamily protein